MFNRKKTPDVCSDSYCPGESIRPSPGHMPLQPGSSDSRSVSRVARQLTCRKHCGSLSSCDKYWDTGQKVHEQPSCSLAITLLLSVWWFSTLSLPPRTYCDPTPHHPSPMWPVPDAPNGQGWPDGMERSWRLAKGDAKDLNFFPIRLVTVGSSPASVTYVSETSSKVLNPSPLGFPL